QNVVVVYVFQTGLPGDIQPQTMEQHDVLILHGGRVRTDAEGLDNAVGLNDLQQELLFGFWYALPRAPQCEGLLGGGHFAGEPGDDGGRIEIVWGLGDRRPGVPCRDYQERDFFAETLSDRDSPGEQSLLVITEDLLGRKAVSRAPELADARGHDDHVLFVRSGALQHPLEVVQGVVVTDRDEHIPSTN